MRARGFMINYQSIPKVLRTVRRTLFVWSALSVAYFMIALTSDSPFTDSLLLWSAMILALVPPFKRAGIRLRKAYGVTRRRDRSAFA